MFWLKALFAISQIQLVIASNWDTYPQVPKTAVINGFADPIYTLLPSCAQSCVEQDTSNTPCPYWDTGCFCVMPQWSGLVADCFVDQCDAKDVAKASSLAISLCSSVGANQWLLPASVSTDVSEAKVSTHTAVTTVEGTYTFSSTGSGITSRVKETGSADSSATAADDARLISSSPDSSTSSTSSPSSSSGSSSATNGGVTLGSTFILTIAIQFLLSLIL